MKSGSSLATIVAIAATLFVSWEASGAFPMRVQDPESACEPDQACYHVQRKNMAGFWKS